MRRGAIYTCRCLRNNQLLSGSWVTHFQKKKFARKEEREIELARVIPLIHNKEALCGQFSQERERSYIGVGFRSHRAAGHRYQDLRGNQILHSSKLQRENIHIRRSGFSRIICTICALPACEKRRRDREEDFVAGRSTKSSRIIILKSPRGAREVTLKGSSSLALHLLYSPRARLVSAACTPSLAAGVHVSKA